MSTESDVANRVASKLTGQFYVGQKVRLNARGRQYDNGKYDDVIAEVVAINPKPYQKGRGGSGDVLQVNPPLTDSGLIMAWAVESAE